MREIKFRSWLKERKEFIYNFTMDSILDSEAERCILSQYTGLKDSNGREIFEGDIVQQNYKDVYNQNQAFVGEVVYSDCVYWLKNGDEYTFLYDEYRIYNSVVIGNVYQNPELLEGVNVG
ncbi:YopX family protein [Rummeliibacillus sp. G93]|uniref:YopX family protein n=1 Tax=Rummeliibacillus sp. G93 TaxID=2939494 RepID=UPI00201BB9B9|nr:YopX family protein [Rummeliibacillus sp. G93]UQW98159.1 YopX family protein [Rummeliibacillus sp. G93]